MTGHHMDDGALIGPVCLASTLRRQKHVCIAPMLYSEALGTFRSERARLPAFR